MTSIPLLKARLSPNLRQTVGGLIAASVLAQGLALVWLEGLSGVAAMGLVLGALGLAWFSSMAWRYRERFSNLDILLVTAGLGGLGMIIGIGIDGPGSGHTPAHAMGHRHMGMGLWNWMTLLMVLFCLPACLWFCDGPCRLRSAGIRFFAHLMICGSMLAGMQLGAAWLSTWLGLIVKLKIVSAHLGMVVGMVAGAAFATSGLAGVLRGPDQVASQTFHSRLERSGWYKQFLQSGSLQATSLQVVHSGVVERYEKMSRSTNRPPTLRWCFSMTMWGKVQ